MDSTDDLIGYLEASGNRRAVLKALRKSRLTPTQISEKSGLLATNVSKILAQLSSKGLIRCTTHGLRKGKLFVLTEQGHAILKEIS